MCREMCPSRISGDGHARFSGMVKKRMEALIMEKWNYDAEFPEHARPLSRPQMRRMAANAVVEELCTPPSVCACLDAIDPDPTCNTGR